MPCIPAASSDDPDWHASEAWYAPHSREQQLLPLWGGWSLRQQLPQETCSQHPHSESADAADEEWEPDAAEQQGTTKLFTW
jgi:hypothetical protein